MLVYHGWVDILDVPEQDGTGLCTLGCPLQPIFFFWGGGATKGRHGQHDAGQ